MYMYAYTYTFIYVYMYTLIEFEKIQKRNIPKSPNQSNSTPKDNLKDKLSFKSDNVTNDTNCKDTNQNSEYYESEWLPYKKITPRNVKLCYVRFKIKNSSVKT